MINTKANQVNSNKGANEISKTLKKYHIIFKLNETSKTTFSWIHFAFDFQDAATSATIALNKEFIDDFPVIVAMKELTYLNSLKP